MESFEALVAEAKRRPLVGWDLSYDGRIAHGAPPWDFGALADARIVASPNLLDLGTGGGEWLSRRPFPRGRTVATEAWPPNVAIAAARLRPLGAQVIAVEGAPDNTDQAAAPRLPPLPFADNGFLLVTSRHESFVAVEVRRVLAPGGRFLTQQIQSNYGDPFRRLLGLPTPVDPGWTLAKAARQVEAAGLRVTERAAGAAELAFADVGALAWYLINVPWVLPEATPDDWIPRLEALHGAGPFTVPQTMFWLEAARA